ncbi:family 11 glycoside hydrolase [Mycena vulgaris]|nr:family 11 glycoside hydrolase [Mycena vulgaris]
MSFSVSWGPNPTYPSIISVYGWSWARISTLSQLTLNDPYTGWSTNRLVEYQHKRTSGSVTSQSHENGWAALDMHLGTMNLQIMAVEGLSSSGQATVTVS